jgi:hypothetical protein
MDNANLPPRFVPGERIVWMGDWGTSGPITSIVVSDSGNGYWCHTDPNSKVDYVAWGDIKYFVWDRDIKKYLNRKLALWKPTPKPEQTTLTISLSVQDDVSKKLREIGKQLNGR